MVTFLSPSHIAQYILDGKMLKNWLHDGPATLNSEVIFDDGPGHALKVFDTPAGENFGE
jgi:hypothetical protein